MWLDDGRAQFGDALISPRRVGAGHKAGDKVVLGVRAENINVTDTAHDSLKAVIDFAEYLGGTRYLYCALEDGQALVIEERSGRDFGSGQTIHLAFSAERSFLFDGNGVRLR